MKDIIKIRIKDEPADFGGPKGYIDSFSITPDSIEYELKIESNDLIYPRYEPVKWSYKTSNKIFKDAYAEIVSCVEEIMDPKFAIWACDTGIVTFQVTYSDGTEELRDFICPEDVFDKIFRVIRFILPPLEEMPALPAMMKYIEENEDADDEDGPGETVE